MVSYSVGSIIKCRGRIWIVYGKNEDSLILNPLWGSSEESVVLYEPLLHLEDITPASFSPPRKEDLGNFRRARLLAEAVRLSLRSTITSVQCAGRINFEPRPFQFVPLILALRLNPVRLLIADDVGVGKTIEAGLIVKELIERGEIRRFIVLCPPYLVDQWVRELKEKFDLSVEAVTSKNMARLERKIPESSTVFEYFPYLVASIDYIKRDKWKSIFLKQAPEMVVVDEAHACTKPPGRIESQHQRYELVRALADDPNRHLLLLTATPHSGIEESFRSLLGFLDREFEHINLGDLSKEERRRERERIAKHFIQRKRADVKEWLGKTTPFPERESEDLSYDLSSEYRQLFEDVYAFTREMVVRTAKERLSPVRRRMRFLAALALLRSVMSSPEAAKAALESKLERMEEQEDEFFEQETLFSSLIYDPSESLDDTVPQVVVERQIKQEEESFRVKEGKVLKQFKKQVEHLSYSNDEKFKVTLECVKRLLEEEFNPVIYCRFIATAEYVAEGLRMELEKQYPELGIYAITGRLTEDERRIKVEELGSYSKRILVATDCLSEGINLQEHFNAVIHYDLPWNPNRLEQREGRIDRFGQRSPVVKTFILYGKDNPVDGAILDILLKKAREIHKDLGIMVPIPHDHSKVVEAIVQSLFSRENKSEQLYLFDTPELLEVSEMWEKAAEREKKSRTIFAHKKEKLQEELSRELEELRERLGSQEDVERFTVEALQALNTGIRKSAKGYYAFSPRELPEYVKAKANLEEGTAKISFNFPPPEDALFIGRNHPLVEGLSEFILNEALVKSSENPVFPRSSVIRTDAVNRRTELFLLRARYQASHRFLEEVFVYSPQTDEKTAWKLLYTAEPRANVLEIEKNMAFEEAIRFWETLQNSLEDIFSERAHCVEETINRLRKKGEKHLRVRFIPPADLLGVYVLLPISGG